MFEDTFQQTFSRFENTNLKSSEYCWCFATVTYT